MPHFHRSIALLCLLLALAIPAHAQEEPADAPDEISSWLTEHIPDEQIRQSTEVTLRDAGENWTELAAALEASMQDDSRILDMLWLLDNAPHLDRLELRSAMLLENHELAIEWCGVDGYEQESEFFRRYILNYRIDDEPVTAWRAELRERYRPDEPTNVPAEFNGGPYLLPQETVIEQLVERVASGFRIVERGYFGNLADPLAIDNARAGTERELALLCAAVLRSQGFATRFTRENMTGTSWVEVYTGVRDDYDPASWSPVYPQAPGKSGMPSHALQLCGGRIAVITAGDAFGREQVTDRYTTVAGVQPLFSRDGKPLPDFEHWTITAWHEGSYVPLDDLGYPTALADYPLTDGAAVEDEEAQTYYLGAPGDYRLQAGLRYPGGTVQVLTRDFSINPGSLTTLELAMQTPLDLPDEALRERSIVAELPQGFEWLSEGVQLFFVHDESEPSVRTAMLVQEFDRRDDMEFHSLPWQPRPEGWEKPEDYEPQLERDVLGIAENDEMPVVILLVDGELKLYLRGYNLNVADWIRRQLGDEAEAAAEAEAMP